ncbi:response regulator transcription factor [Nocardia uniformis]|uniref:Response regulator transcription factor n=1 Tax=Nocardia uniformis TaxID=53432 RepID=A0A849CEW3_9NOCA|nr:response regulator transcription factor [Nocardia uniformis]NNH75260.1 response regulator transcription factor [Nocardia uniformis]
MIRVLFAGSLRLPREAMATVLSGVPGVDVVAQVPLGTDVVPSALRTRPTIALLDADLAGLDGVSAAVQLKSALPGCRVLLMTPPNRPDLLRSALAARVEGLLSKDVSISALTDAVCRVARGERVLEAHTVAEVLHMPGNPLGARDIDILRLAAAGRTPGEIAAALHLSPGTIRNILAAINRKLGARNRIEAIRIATHSGWI